MISNTSHAAIRNIRTALTAAVGKLPAPVQKAYDDLNTLTTAKPGNAPTIQDVHAAAADAILDGRNPYEDAKVRELSALAAIAPDGADSLHWGITAVAFNRVYEVITEHTDELAALIKDTADNAGATLAKAHAVLGDLELNDAESIIRIGPAGAQAWIDAKAARKAADQCVNAWLSLAAITHITTTEPVFLLADLDHHTVNRIGRQADAWAIVRAGGTIDFATPETAATRRRAYGEAVNAATTAPAEAFQDAWARQHRIA